MNDRIEIRLTEINEEPVGLNAMTVDALESFMEVVSSLKSIVENIVDKEALTFSIKEGSALCSVEAAPAHLQAIYREINTAIEGESSNKEVADGLRRIQNQIKRNNVEYEFQYHQSSSVIDMHGKLVQASRIAVKRRRGDYTIKLKANSGVIKQIGGEKPNYHLYCVNGEKRTIECTREDAIQVNKFLYQEVNPLVLCKEFTRSEKKDEFIHLTMIDNDLASAFREFVATYNHSDDLISRLGKIHDFIDEQFENTHLGHRILKTLILGFNDELFHLSEIKTVLVISKPFKEHDLIRDPRAALLETYNAKRT